MTSKKVKVEAEEDDERRMDTKSGSEESSDDENDEVYEGDEGITVDFEGRNPIDPDLDGIKQLLGQLFVKAHIDLAEMAGVIIGQNYVGSVLKQTYNDGDEDDEDDDTDMEDPSQVVFGVTSVINLSNKQDLTCVRQLKKMLFEKAEKYATELVIQQFREALEGGSKTTGLLLNERFINIPAAVCVPMCENLLNEMERARSKGMPYTFDYYLMFVKYYQQAAAGDKSAEVIYSNDEEEYFIKDSCASFDYSVQKETTTALAGQWQKKDDELQPFRKVLLIEASKLPGIVSTIKNLVASVTAK
ncbi:protein BCCIP homolog [Anopheles ziemanni]|uniref:protein BCCIP homolog n=1 Tax=Anopheles coustani TaxID=139045 RepID=UPI00265A19F3|nr:protein BCCIP homolog [Anopheles coustani]XP_058172409.1 protein BCCIP homolog [Anopheles ziemanni]